MLILGGGVAGLAAAYELRKLGYHVRVIEARTRPGGRCWTVRAGATETEIGGETQVCRFTNGNSLNLGPMRIPHHHATTLDYCREFGLPLVPFTNFNQAAFVHRTGQPRRTMREVTTNLRGHTSELLAKVARRDALDAPLTAEDREKLIAYLRGEGRLTEQLDYPRTGDTSEFENYRDHPLGYAVSPAAQAEFGAPNPALELEALIKAGFAQPDLAMRELHQQDTMLTISGGMDRLPHAFAERLEGMIDYGAEVREIRRTATGGVVVSGVAESGAWTKEADHCICAMPPRLLAGLDADFSTETLAALRQPIPDGAGKIGLQFKRRFWEEDDEIFGGRSVTNQPISQLYYPFEDFGKPGPGVMVGYYHFSDRHAEFDVPHAEREARALAEGALLHPQYPAEFENSFSVEWNRIRHSGMSWAWWRNGADFDRMLKTLRAGDGPFYFAGDWASVLTGWQAGAFVTAQSAVAAIHSRAHAP